MKRLNSFLKKRGKTEHTIVRTVFVRSLVTYVLNATTWAIGTIVDGIIIGNYLGVEAMAAYGMIWPVTLLFGLIGGILSGGSRNIYTKLAGQGHLEEANRVFSLACGLAALLSLVVIGAITAFAGPIAGLLGATGQNAHLQVLVSRYLTGIMLGLPFDSIAKILSGYLGMDSDYRRVITATVAMTVTDIVGDYLAVTVFDGSMFLMGLTTAIGQLVYCAVLSTHFLRKNRMLRVTFRKLRSTVRHIPAILANGTPAGTTRISSALGGILVNRILSAAATGTYIAAFSINKSLASLVSALYLGVADTVWTLSSIYYGEEDRKALHDLQANAYRIGIPLSLAVAGVFFLVPRFFAGIYFGSADAETLSLASEAVRFFSLCVPLYLVVYIFVDYLMGIGRLKEANIFGFILEFGASVPVVWGMVRLFGGRGVWYASPVTLLIVLICSFLYILRWREGDSFRDKRLLVDADFGAERGSELNISADSKTEVLGMSRLAGLFCRENGIDEKKANALALCIEELGCNIIDHGFNDGRPHCIDIRILVKDGELILRIRDDCQSFNLPEQYAMRQVQENDPTKNVGIRMVMKMSRDVQYLSTMSTNNLIIRI